MEKLYSLTAGKLIEMMKAGSIGAADIASDTLSRVESVDSRVKAFVRLEKERILAKKTAKGRLSGIPVAIKDNICVKDEETSCASRILKGFKPPYDATVIKKLQNEGAVLFGKTNMDEFAFGSSCETSCYGPTRNPWGLDRIPGGSSGGSAAAVAADETIMAIGSDTGGSIRQPASLCGVVGLKPTYGRVSRYGLIAFASSLDQIGPITKDVRDAAILLEVSGYDEMDSTSVDIPVPHYVNALTKDIKGLRIGVPKEYFIKGIDKDVDASVKKSIDIMKGLGAKIIDISLPHTEYAVSVYYIIAPAEASSNLARFDGMRYGFRDTAVSGLMETYLNTRSKGFGDEAKRRILLGTYSLSTGYYEAYYLKAQKVRTKIKEDFEKAFGMCDIVITPTSPTAAFKIGEKTKDPLSMYLSDIFTIPANMAGIPAVSIPCGFNQDGLPIGLQFIGRPFDEEGILRAAYAFEQATDFHKRKPNL